MHRLDPASAAAIASTDARTTLLSGCWAVRVEPAVKAKIRSCWDRGSAAPYSSRRSRAQTRRAARNFATSWRTSVVMARKVKSVGATASIDTPARTHSSR